MPKTMEPSSAGLASCSKGDFIPRSRISIADITGAGHPRAKSYRAAVTDKRDTNRPATSQFEYRLSDVDSLSTFLDHLSSFPPSCFSQEYGAMWEPFRQIFGGARNHFVGDGASFSAYATTGRQLDFEPVVSAFPQMLLKKHEIVVTKVPKIEQVPKDPQQILKGVKEDALRAVAWETHCLFHPPIQKSKHIVELLGIGWEPVRLNHPSVGSPSHTPVPTLIMEYADEGTLDDLLQSGEDIAVELKMKLGQDVALGLTALHDCGVVHCDLKANNVLLFKSDEQTLIAKVSDFGCAMHSFGPDASCRLPPYWPRWDAPEARPDQPSVDIQDLPKVDVYTFGLLVWQLIFGGKTPFDRKREMSPLFKQVAQFGPVLATDAGKPKERELAIANLKDGFDDEMLRGVQASIRLLKLDNPRLDSIIEHTLRREPRQRQSMTQIVDIFGTPSETGLKPIQTGAGEVMSTTTVTTNIKPQDRIEIEDWFRSLTEDDQSRIYYGSAGTYRDIVQLSRLADEKLPNMVKRALCFEYHDIAIGNITKHDPPAMCITHERKAFSALQHGLCNFLGFGCIQDDKKGLDWITKAADMGSWQARVLLYRLQAASQGVAPEATETIKGWLEFATARGSVTAHEDLIVLDPVKAHASRRKFLDDNFGLCDGLIDKMRDKILQKYHMQDAERFCADLLSRIGGQTGRPQDVAIVDENVDESGHSLLHYACALGNLSAVNTLLENGASINKQNSVRETALGYACRCSYPDIALKLLDHGASAGLSTIYGASAMHYLVYLEGKGVDLDRIAERLVERGGDLNAASMHHRIPMDPVGGEYGVHGSPLQWAVLQNRPDVVRVLLRLGANPLLESNPYQKVESSIPLFQSYRKNADDTNSSLIKSPLFFAAHLNRAEILKTMLEHEAQRSGAGVDYRLWVAAPMSTSRLMMMIHNGINYKKQFDQVMDLAKPAMMANPDTILVAIKHGSVMAVDYLLRSGWDVNTPVAELGAPPLFVALYRGETDVAMCFLEHGADPKYSAPGRSTTPLATCVPAPESMYTCQVIRKLLDGGRDYAHDEHSFTHLYHRAVMDGWESVADMLVQRGVPREVEDLRLYAKLLRQNSAPSAKGITYLLKHAPAGIVKNPCVNKETGDNVLHCLVAVEEDIRNDELNNLNLESLLRVFGSPQIVDARNNRGHTPAMEAVLSGNHGAIKALATYKADLSTAPSAIDMIVNRVLNPRKFEGGSSTASSRGRKRHRYIENTVRLLSVLLGHLHSRGCSPNENDAEVHRSISRWQSRGFLKEVVDSNTSAIVENPVLRLKFWMAIVKDWEDPLREERAP